MSRLALTGGILIAISIPLLVIAALLGPVEPRVSNPITIAAAAGLIGGCILLAGGCIAEAIRTSGR